MGFEIWKLSSGSFCSPAYCIIQRSSTAAASSVMHVQEQRIAKRTDLWQPIYLSSAESECLHQLEAVMQYVSFRITLQSNSKWLNHNTVFLSSTRRDHVRSPTRSNLRVLRYRSTKWWLRTCFCCSWTELLMRLFFTTSFLYSCSGDYKTAVKLGLKPDIATWQITRALLAYSFSCLRKHTEAMAIAHSLIEV